MPGRDAAVVLAGGRSRRMGVGKAGLAWRGTTLLGALLEALEPVVGALVVVRAPGQALPPVPAAVEVVEDRAADRGPLEGMLVGLRAADAAERALVCAVDHPWMTTALARRLLAGLDGGSEAAVPLLGGRPQPLAAAYRTDLAGPLARLLGAGERRAGALLAGRRVTWLDEAALLADPRVRAADPALDGLRDIDTPADYAAAQASSDIGTSSPAATPLPSSGSQASAWAPASEVIE